MNKKILVCSLFAFIMLSSIAYADASNSVNSINDSSLQVARSHRGYSQNGYNSSRNDTVVDKIIDRFDGKQNNRYSNNNQRNRQNNRYDNQRYGYDNRSYKNHHNSHNHHR